VSIHDALRGGEFPNIIVACLLAVETGLDAITFILDLRKCEVDFGSDTGDIEASNI
jgi:hypothetical protein